MQKKSDITNKRTEELLKSIPSPDFPQSLSAESLFAKMDSGELSIDNMGDNVIDLNTNTKFNIKHYLKPILTYASVFIIAVFIYYTMDLDIPSYTEEINTVSQSATALSLDTPTSVAVSPEEKSSLIAVPETITKSIKGNFSEEENLMHFYNDIMHTLPQKENIYYPPHIESFKNSNGKKHSSINYNEQNDTSEIQILDKENLHSTIKIKGGAIDFFSIDNNNIGIISSYTDTKDLYKNDLLKQYSFDGIVDENDFNNVTYFSLYNIEDKNNPQLMYTSLQEGKYIKHKVEKDKVIVATYKPITEKGIVAPLVAENDNVFMPINPQNIYKFKDIPNNEYIILSLCEFGNNTPRVQSKAVLGNNMIVDINTLMKNITIFAQDIETDVNKIIDFELADYKVRLS